MPWAAARSSVTKTDITRHLLDHRGDVAVLQTSPVSQRVIQGSFYFAIMAQVPAGEGLDHLLQVLKTSQASSISTQCSCWVKGIHGIEGVELEDLFFWCRDDCSTL
jgi:hypothetical protein